MATVSLSVDAVSGASPVARSRYFSPYTCSLLLLRELMHQQNYLKEKLYQRFTCQRGNEDFKVDFGMLFTALAYA